MSDIRTLFGKLGSLIDVDTNMPEIVQQIDAVEGENLRPMTNISEQIRSLDNEASATRSNTSLSGSNRSRTSHRSFWLDASKRSDVAIKAATLMSKLKFMDLEAKSKVELEKIQTLKQLEVARTKLEILDSDTQPSNFDTLLKDGMNELLDRYMDLNNVPEVGLPHLRNLVNVYTSSSNINEPFTRNFQIDFFSLFRSVKSLIFSLKPL